MITPSSAEENTVTTPSVSSSAKPPPMTHAMMPIQLMPRTGDQFSFLALQMTQ